MNVKTIINIGLVVVVAALGFYLYKIIQEPIIFEEQKKVRVDATVQSLKNIRSAQLAYKDKYGKFSKDFNALISALKNDQFPQVKIIGNPDDTSQVVQYDTTFVKLYDRAFKEDEKVNLDSLSFVPYGGGAKFDLDAGEIEKNRVKIQVFEATVVESVVLKDLKATFDKYIDDKKYYSVGSMTEGTLSGNWE